MHQKLAADPFFILLNNSKQTLHAGNSFENKKLWKIIIKKPLKSQLYFFFRTQSLFMDSYQKQKGSGTSDQSLFRLRNKFRKIPLFFIYYVTKFDDVMWSSFWVIAKIASTNLCKSIYDIIKYSTSICPFESRNCGKERKKLQKIEYLENNKSFLDEIKGIFHSF